MNIRLLTKVTTLVLLTLGIYTTTNAQLTVDVSLTPDQMTQNLVGNGVTISNTLITAADSSYGYFNSIGTEIGTTNGLLLTTGSVFNAIGPNDSNGFPDLDENNNCLNCDDFDNDFMGNALLTTANGGLTTWDACMYEFDIIPQGDSLSFEYHFASEEYLEWVNSDFNDVFGFFISGPGLVDVNIATLPGSATAVSINTVNHIDNTGFFYDNITPAGTGIQYDGFTINTVASIGDLMPCETYHIKLIIADGSDHLYDSGVFISKIESNPAVIETSTVEGLPYMIEGCNNGNINIVNPFPVVGNTDVEFTLSGDAIFGVDYTTNPDLTAFYDAIADSYTLTILDGETTIGFEILPIFDGINEGTELITIDLLYQLCDNTLSTSGEFAITDELPVSISTPGGTICPGDCVELTGSAETLGTAVYSWSPTTDMTNENTLSPTVCPESTTTYTLTNTAGACTNSESIEVIVTPLTANLDVTNATCSDVFAGAIDITMTSGLANYEYSWTGPNGFSSTDEDISGLEVGEYCVTVIDATDCSTTFCATVNFEDLIDVATDISDFGCSNEVSCNGLSDGFINIDISGGNPSYDTEWTLNGVFYSNDEDITGLAAGTYEVTIVDSDGCEDITSYIIDEPEVVSITVSSVFDVLCFGDSTGIIEFDPTGGCSPYLFSWDHDATLTAPIAVVAAGTYTVTATDINGCANNGSVTVVVDEPLEPVTVVIDNVLIHLGGFNVSCPTAEDGAVDITVTGGTPGGGPLYTFEWLHIGSGTIITDEDPINLACGDWQLTVTDGNGCTNIQTINLTCVPPISISFDSTPNACDDPNGGAGEITITSISGGNGGAYTIISWAGPSCGGCAGMSLTNLDSGNYTVVVEDNQGCQQSFTINVGTNDNFTVVETITDETCSGACDGAISADVVPAVYDSVQWFGPDGYSSTDEDITDLCPGNYSLLVVSGTCEETFIYNVAAAPEVNIELTATTPSCFGVNDGEICVVLSGGTGVLTPTWTADVDCFFPNTGSNNLCIDNLLDCTYYISVVDDANPGCIVTDSLVLESPNSMIISVSLSEYNGGFNTSCPESTDGSASASVTGGTEDCVANAPECYNYEWFECESPDPFFTGSFVNDLAGGCYSVVVTDSLGCIATTNIVMVSPPPFELTAVVSPMSCNDTIAPEVILTYTGGSGTIISYNWLNDIGSNADDALILVDLPLGTYCVAVTDNNACTDTLCFDVVAPEIITITEIAHQNVSCFGGNDGFSDVVGSNGTDPYQYSWNDEPLDSTGLNNNLIAGTYEVLVVDDLGCENTLTVVITEPDELLVNLTVPSIIENAPFTIPCKGDSIVIVPVIEGGTQDYDYLWQNCDDTFITNDEGNLEIGVGCYELEITDFNGCTALDTIIVTEPDSFLIASTIPDVYPNGLNISCGGADDGGICAEVSGGVPDYDYLWTQNNEEISFDECIADLGPGTYELLIIDANGCDTLISTTLTEPPPIIIDGESIDATCFEVCDGSITINPSGGTGVLDIEWDPIAADPLALVDLCAGEYTVTVTDDFDCEAEVTFTISEPDLLTANADIINISCFGDGNGSIDLTPAGGSGDYTCNWDNAAVTCDISSLDAGVYCVTIADSNSPTCFIDTCYTITEPEILQLSLQTVDATCGLSNGTVVGTPQGGVTPYNFNWNGIDNTGVLAGTYSVTLTDDNNCTVIDTYTINGPTAPTYDAFITNLICPGTQSGEIDLTLTGGNTPTSVCWEQPDGTPISCTQDLDELSGGTYVLVIEWGDDCTTTDDSFNVTEPNPIVINGNSPTYIFNFNISEAGGEDGSIETNVQGGSPNYTYTWTNDQGIIIPNTSNPTDLTAGEYNLTVLDVNNCVSDTTFILTEVPDVALPTGITPNGDGSNDFYVILGIQNHGENTFKVYNRWGNLVYERSNYNNEWNGQNNDGEELPNATYFIVYEAQDISEHTYVDLRR